LLANNDCAAYAYKLGFVIVVEALKITAPGAFSRRGRKGFILSKICNICFIKSFIISIFQL